MEQDHSAVGRHADKVDRERGSAQKATMQSTSGKAGVGITRLVVAAPPAPHQAGDGSPNAFPTAAINSSVRNGF
jgi:hypothetical protein